MFPRVPFFAACLFGISLASSAAPPAAAGPSGPVSRKPPAIYTEQLAPLLTPLKTVMATRGDFTSEGSNGMILLDENIVYADAEGRRIIVFHRVEEAYTESGVNTLAEETHSYRTADQRIHLVEARSILPDGRELKVEDRAAFLESPQSDAGDSVYGDRGQLRLIFSGIRPEVVREMIVVVEEETPRIPGHLTAQEHWGAFWPERRAHAILLMPDAVANRVHVTELGTGVPEVVKTEWRPGWRKWTWTKEKVRPLRFEGGRPPGDQVGPAAMLTTLPDWDAFGAWYRGLLGPAISLPPALKAQLAEWTKDAKTPAAKLEAVIRHVSRDFRYTGLEFGLGAFQPRTPEEILNTGYGDCKDKSNLAVQLLRELGIEANLVLLQTEHAGRVEKRSPDYRHFNHAILIAIIDGKPLFCDPTIRYGKPGMLAASSSDRDVLVVSPEKVEWARTPPFANAEIGYGIDAKLDSHGTLEGWLEMLCTGYFDSSNRAYYEQLGRDELRRDLQEMLTDLLPGARLIDAEQGKAGGPICRAFFSLPSQGDEGEDRQVLHFPAGDPVMLSVDDDETRESARFLWPLTWRVSGRITLPAGWQVSETPPPFDLKTEPYDVRASWTIKDGICQAEYAARVTQSLLQPADHPTVWRGTQSLRNWLRKPLRLVRGAATAPGKMEEPAPVATLPLMPTGEGQLALVEQRYPDTGDRSARRAALKKTLEYFPDDAPTVFNARAQLALLDWDEKRPDDALRSLRDLTANPSPKVKEETVWWARYMIGLVLGDLEKYEEATKELNQVIQRKSLSPYRRSWACFQAGYILDKMEKRPEALALVREGLALKELDSTPQLLALCASVLFHLDKQAELKGAIDGVIKDHGAKAAPALTALAQLAGSWARSGHGDWTKQTLTLLQALPPENRTGELTAAITHARDVIAVAGAAADLQKDLQEYLKANPDLPILKAPIDGWPDSLQLTLEAYDKADKASDSDLGSRLAMHSVVAFPPDAQFAARLWKTAAHLESHERNQKLEAVSPLLNLLFKLARRLPKSDDHYFEMRFLEARSAEYRGSDWKRAAAIYEEVTEDPAMPESFLPSGLTRLANCYEALGDWPKTVAALSKLERVKTYQSAGDGLARAAHLRLEMAEPDEALRLLRLIESSRDFALKNSAMPDTLQEFLDVAKDEKASKSRWQSPAWWPQWQKLQKSLGAEEQAVEPMIVDIGAFGAEIGQAIRDKDTAAAGRLARRMAHSARWLPARSVEMAWLCSFQLPALFPDQHHPLLAFVEAVMTDLIPAQDTQRRARLMYLSISHIDRDAAEPALKHLHDYFKTYPADDHPITFAMARLWGSLAIQVKAEQSAAVAVLERTLASKELRSERVRSVQILADLYRALRQADKEADLLKAAIAHPAISAEPQQVAALKQRLEELTAGAAYAQAVQRWLAKYAPVWYEYAKPKDLKSLSEDGDLREAIQKTYDDRELVENIKVYLLAAANETSTVEHIDESWTRGLNLLLLLRVVPEDRLRTELDAALDDPKAPLAMKDTTVRIAYLHAAALEQQELMKHLRGKLAPAQLSSFSRERMAIADTVVGLDLTKPRAAADAVKAQIKKRDPGHFDFMVRRLGDRALEYGKVEVLEAVADALAEARKDAAIEAAQLQSIRLDVIRARSSARRLLPVNNALAQVVLKHPLAQPAKSFVPPRLIGKITYPLLSSRSFLDWAHNEIQRGKRPCDDLDMWFGYLDACSEFSAEKTLDLRRQLIDAAVTAAADDETRAEVVNLAAAGTDIDSPGERSHLLEILKGWRDLAAMPRAQAQVHLLEARVAQRLGQDHDLQTLTQLKGEDIQERISDLRLNVALQSGDAAVVGAALDKLGSDVMLKGGNMPAILRALKLCGRTDELELAIETAEEQLYKAVLMSWTGVSNSSVRRALVLAEALQKPSLLPDAWLKFVAEAYPERHDQLTVTMYAERLKKNWPQVLAAATEATERFPTLYSTYWIKAQALWHLGRKAEVTEPLRIYLQYCHDEPDYAAALALLEETPK